MRCVLIRIGFELTSYYGTKLDISLMRSEPFKSGDVLVYIELLNGSERIKMMFRFDARIGS